MRTMQVTAVTSATVTVTAGGDVIPGVPVPKWYAPTVGDTVRVLWDDTDSNPIVIFATS